MTDSVSTIAKNQSTLVQYFEVWNLDDDGNSMSLQDYTRLRNDGVDSGKHGVDSGKLGRRVRCGEGVAGMAWNQRNAIILQEAPSELLQRIGTQNGLQLTALIAYPILRGQEVLSVIVLGISEGPGAFEVWGRDDRDELSISASYYSRLKNLEFISRYVKFPKGAGLPGTVWKSGHPRLAPNLSSNPTFMRSWDADETHLSTGLCLPVGSAAGNSDSVLLLLSTSEKPIATGFEIWAPKPDGELESQLQTVASDRGPVCDEETQIQLRIHDTVHAAWKTGRAMSSTQTESTYRQAMLAVPVYRGREQVSVVMFMF